jgi:MFS transporter, AAHS family, 4-hydroxybenzoate transporter
MREAGRGVLDIAALIDERPMSALQITAILLCAAVALLDGIDSQSISVAAPILAENLKIARPALGPIFAAAALGSAVGAFAFGPLGDLYGRKRMMAIAATVFGLFTLATAAADSYGMLIAVRFCAGLGLGGAMPCFIALASEYSPQARRARIASFIWAAFPLGIGAGGFLNAFLLATFGWRSIFVVGGVAPLVVAALVVAFMPESVRYLIARGADPARIARIVQRLAPDVLGRVAYVSSEERTQGSPARELFARGRASATFALWLAFFTGFGALGIAVVWTPTLLRDHGVSLQAASIVIGWHGLGALIGMGSAGMLVERFGFARVLIPAFTFGALAIASLGLAADSALTMTIAMVLVGLLVGMAASGSIALAALIYPTSMRATGVGWAMSMARIGQVLAPLAAGALAGFGDATTFYLFGLATFVGALALFTLRLSQGAAPAGAGRGAVA